MFRFLSLLLFIILKPFVVSSDLDDIVSDTLDDTDFDEDNDHHNDLPPSSLSLGNHIVTHLKNEDDIKGSKSLKSNTNTVPGVSQVPNSGIEKLQHNHLPEKKDTDTVIQSLIKKELFVSKDFYASSPLKNLKIEKFIQKGGQIFEDSDLFVFEADCPNAPLDTISGKSCRIALDLSNQDVKRESLLQACNIANAFSGSGFVQKCYGAGYLGSEEI